MFTVVAYRNDCGYPRLGLAVSKKAAGCNVRRNELKRLIRESFRHAQSTLPPLDLVVITRHGSRDASGSEMRTSLEGHWRRIVQKCAV